jgi:prefoldin subunit 5
MSLLSPTSDFTGEMSQSDLNNQDIQNLQEEITRLQQNQDSINQTLNITAQGKKTVTVTAGASGGFQIPFTTLTANTYFKISLISLILLIVSSLRHHYHHN